MLVARLTMRSPLRHHVNRTFVTFRSSAQRRSLVPLHARRFCKGSKDSEGGVAQLLLKGWRSVHFWGTAGAIAGWLMSGAAVYDASLNGPEIISLNMTSVMIVYSSLFARWAWVVQPRNYLLCGCHVANVIAQTNQMRRGIEFKISNGEGDEVQTIGMKAGAFAATVVALIAGGPFMQSAIVGANLGPISTMSAAAAGPFTVHFWAPMSKWLISGASMLDLDRPTDNVRWFRLGRGIFLLAECICGRCRTGER